MAINVIKKRIISLTNVVLLYLFGFSIALYPPFAQYARPILAICFIAILLVVIFDMLFLNKTIPRSILFKIAIALGLVFIIWLLVAVLKKNNLAYALQDSIGFAIYLIVMPVLFIFIKLKNLSLILFDLLINLSIIIASVSFGLVVGYYSFFGSVEPESLIAINAYIKSQGLNWVIDNNNGFLGLYTYTAHFLLLGVGLTLYKYYIFKNPNYLYLIVLFCFGVIADGHRALVVSMILLIILLIPIIMRMFEIKKLTILAFVAASTLLLMLVINFEWVKERYNFTLSDDSTHERFIQIPSLLDKIMESPVWGSGFGAYTSVIRNQERPFLYEVDFLATVVKLGLVGSLLYFGSYLYLLDKARRSGRVFGYILFCVGLSFLFYMGTNGGLAMSPDSSIFHMFLFILISLSLSKNTFDKNYN